MSVNASGAVVRETKKAASAALKNEELTRRRVELLEKRTDNLEQHSLAVGGLLSRRFLGRLRWLVTGR